ncbi:hypothetical protein C6Q18_03280 [Pseudomonas chlororaphis subsp. piscium]|nr:hypothetical protein C6Q18_03280 [Pseudomonas chlororaphis subsp. piscium]
MLAIGVGTFTDPLMGLRGFESAASRLIASKLRSYKDAADDRPSVDQCALRHSQPDGGEI